MAETDGSEGEEAAQNKAEQPSKEGSLREQIVLALREMTQNKFYIFLFLVATIFALYADDLRRLFLPKDADDVITGFMFATLLLFGRFCLQ